MEEYVLLTGESPPENYKNLRHKMTDIKDEASSCKWRESKQLLLAIVVISLFIDSMLVTTVDPIIPQYLEQMRHAESISSNPATSNVTTTANSITNFKVDETERKLNSSNELLIDQSQNTVSSETEKNQHDNLKSSAETGILFGSKALVQLFVNPIVGPVTQKIGYARTKMCGCLILCISTLLFAFGETYEILFLARAIHGVATSCTLVAGMGALSARYKIQQKRDNAIRLALVGSALGFMLGPLFGGFMYQYYRKTTPFLVLSGISLMELGLQFLAIHPEITKIQILKPTLWTLIKDPYIAIAATGMLLSCAQFTFIETNLTLWVMDTMNSEKWILPTLHIPLLLGFIVILNIFGHWCLRMGRWLMAMLGMIFVALFVLLIIVARNPTHLIIPNLGLGMGIGMSQTAIMPEFAHLVDIRYAAAYGNAFAIGDFSRCLGYAFGSMIGGILVRYVGFINMTIVVAILSFIYSPLMFLLKNPPEKNKKSVQGEEKSAVNLIGLT